MIEQFVSYHRSRGWAASTARRRAYSLALFASRIAPRSFAEATRMDVEAFLGAQEKVTTRHAYRSDLRSFYRWAVDHELMPHDPTEKVEPVKVPPTLPRPIASTDAVELAMTDARPPARARIALGFYAGLRISEIAALTVENIDLQHDTITVRAGKGGKDRVVDMHSSLRAILVEVMPESGPLFPGTVNGHVGPATVAASIVRQLNRHGIKATSHQLRHTYGSEMTRVTGGDLVTVGGQMGHTSTQTTQGYAGWAGRGKAAVQAMYPGGDAA